MEGVNPILLGHFYPNATSDFLSEDRISGYWHHKELKLGNKCLKQYPYPTPFGKLHITSSDPTVIAVDHETNKISAIGIGRVEIEIFNDGVELLKFSAEVIDDIDKEVDNAEKIYINECISIFIEDIAKYTTSEGKECELEPYQLKIDIYSYIQFLLPLQ